MGTGQVNGGFSNPQPPKTKILEQSKNNAVEGNAFVDFGENNTISNDSVYGTEGIIFKPLNQEKLDKLRADLQEYVEEKEYESRIAEKLDEIRTEEYGPKYEDLSKADRKEIDKEIEKMEEDGTYGDEDNIVKDPNNPGVEYQQVGDFVEAKVTLYEGLAFDELPEEDQEAVLDYEKNKEDIMNSSLSDAEKEAAIAALDKPDCMDDISYEYRYTEGNVDDIKNNEEEAEEEKNKEEERTK